MNFFRKQKGSITVLVTLILVPTIFFEGFLVDLARIKLYSSQTVMAADDYGEAVLSMYDNLLKELYGLFAVTQDTDALAKLDELDDYIASSFKPNSNRIQYENLDRTLEKLGVSEDYEGFMPYSDADVTLSYETISDSALSNEDILATQIGDFMKFRVVNSLLGDDSQSALFKAIESAQNMQKDAEAIGQLQKVSEAAEDAVDAAKAYYEVLKKFKAYPEYLKAVAEQADTTEDEIEEIADTSTDTHYKKYYDYMLSDEEDRKAAVEKAQQIENNETDEELTDEEQELVDIDTAYNDDSDARKEKLEDQFDDSVDDLETVIATQKGDIYFDNFNTLCSDLASKAQAVQTSLTTLNECREKLAETLQSEDVSSEIKDGAESDLSDLDKLFETGGSAYYSADNYTAISDYVTAQKSANQTLKDHTDDMVTRMNEIIDDYLEPLEEREKDYEDNIDEGSYQNTYQDFYKQTGYQKLYDSLVGMFEPTGDSQEDKIKAKEEEAEQAQSDMEAELEESKEEDSNTTARDVPECLGTAKKEASDDDSNDDDDSSFPGNLISSAASLFSLNNLKEEANKLLLKTYTMTYDFGMFSSRVTNVKSSDSSTQTDSDEDDDSSSDKAASLTGYEMSRSINYLYQAEMEYIFGGKESSKDNLAAARDRILAFRSVVNFTATYSVSEINSPIKAIGSAASGVNPLLGIAVVLALRLAVAGIETVADWNLLKSGDKVCLIKTSVDDLSSKDVVLGMVNAGDIQVSSSTTSTSSGGKSVKDYATGIELDYQDYLAVMIIFMTTTEELYERTADLITLNLNTVKQKIGENGTLDHLDFKMQNAYTAVNATCTVHLDFAVMPNGFAKKVTDSSTYSELEQYEKNSYSYTVTRGY